VIPSRLPTQRLINGVLLLLFLFYWVYVRQLEHVDITPFWTQTLLMPNVSPLVYLGGFLHWRVLRHFLPLLAGWFFAREAAMLLVQRLYDLPDKNAGLRYLNRLSRSGDAGERVEISAQSLRSERDTSVLLRIGGPGLVQVPAGAVLVSEIEGRFHRILPAGAHLLVRAEFPYKLLELRPQERAANDIPLITKDGIAVSAHIGLTYQLRRGAELPTMAEPFPYDETAVRAAAYVETVLEDGSVAAWEDVPLNAARGLLRQITAYYPLDNLIAPESPGDDPLSALKNELSRKLSARLDGIGIDLLDVRVGPLKLPDQISDAYIEYWRTQLQGQMDVRLQNGLAMANETLDIARAEAEMTMIQAILEGVQRASESGATTHMDEIVALRLVEMLENIAEQTRPSGQATHKLQSIQQELREGSTTLMLLDGEDEEG
jgi:regulator of protease activity HflC (stomatin/prohibitin superfamily)